jgi:hypothetical protein
MSEPAQDISKNPNKAQTTVIDKGKKRKKQSSATGKALTELSQQDLTRTHKAFGLFPNALLLFGYGENKHQNWRVDHSPNENLHKFGKRSSTRKRPASLNRASTPNFAKTWKHE